MMKNFRSTLVGVTLFLVSSLTLFAQASTLYFPASPLIHPFGQYVLHDNPDWDRYLMYFSANSAVRGGKPVGDTFTPIDPGTYNTQCGTAWGDRIWLTWSFGDGKNPLGWNAPDCCGNTPPFLLLGLGAQDTDGDGTIEPTDYQGIGERALIGDPAVVFWQGKWHMYYEGTDDCAAAANRIFHATADSWFGPWTKKGLVTGLGGSTAGSGQSWPTLYIESPTKLGLYFTDGNVQLLAADTTDPNGQAFVAIPGAVVPQQANRGQVIPTATGFKLVYDVFTGTTVEEIRASTSTNRYSFPAGKTAFAAGPAHLGFADFGLGLPSVLKVGSEERVYFTGHTYSQPSWLGWEVSQISVGTLGALAERLTNGGFESITANANSTADLSWSRTAFSGPTTMVLVANASQAYEGTDFANLGQSNSASQTLDHTAVFIPTNATTATLSFRVSVVTSEAGPAANDTLSVKLVNASTGAVLATLLNLSNLNDPNLGYTLKSLNVLPYKNKNVKIRFVATTNASNATIFRVDNVSLKADG